MRRKKFDDEGKLLEKTWYHSYNVPAEALWPECSACGTRARILSDDEKLCLRCRVARMKKTRLAGRAGAREN